MRSRNRRSRGIAAVAVVLGLLIALLGVVLVGASGQDRAEATPLMGVTDRLVFAPSDFIPTRDIDYYNNGVRLWTTGNGAAVECFTAPVEFRVEMPVKKVRINRVFMWVYDNQPDRAAHLSLYRTVPKYGTEAQLGMVDSADSATSPAEYSFRGYGQPVFLWNNDPYLWMCLPENVHFYGAAINYSY